MKGIVERDREQFSESMIQKYKSEYVFQICFTVWISVCKPRSALKLVTGRYRTLYWHFSNVSFFFNHLYLLTLCSRVYLEMFIIVWLIIPPFLEPKASLYCSLDLKFSKMNPVQVIAPCSDILFSVPQISQNVFCFIFSS